MDFMFNFSLSKVSQFTGNVCLRPDCYFYGMIKRLAPWLLCAMLAGCSSRKETNSEKIPMTSHDPHSFAQPDSARMTHLSLDLKVDFKRQVLEGTATCLVDVKPGAPAVLFDTRDLSIASVAVDGQPVRDFQLGDSVEFLGRALRVPVTEGKHAVLIRYSTSPKAAALQWLNPQQTAGKKQPFLFTQSQAILARTWAPVQDSPGIRFTYDATLRVPDGLMAVMSAENPVARSQDGIYRFKMEQAIPAYLLALAVGDFDYHRYDHRCGVYAEPTTMGAAADEFTDLPKMIAAAEQLYGPYAWGRYDLIILPPSFPFGGMENPRVTFATPTIIAGDKSLTTLVAHELAHSWSGNLVTNATWNDFWLNEGFTVYFENRIMEALYGKDFADMQRRLGQDDLLETVNDLGAANPDTRLKLDLKGRDPDDGVSDIAYEKGNNLLLVIEQYTGREKWDRFLNDYFRKHAFSTMTTEAFLEELRAGLFAQDPGGWDSLKIEEWVYRPGLPANMLRIESERFNKVEQVVANWKNGVVPTKEATNGWSAFEWVHFLRSLPDSLSQQDLRYLDDTFGFSRTGNNEILFAWMEYAIRAGYSTVYPALESFLTEVGRRKYVKPLFQALLKTPQGRVEAQKIYAAARPNYHPITQATVDELMAEMK
jgi:aminopeptidase N